MESLRQTPYETVSEIENFEIRRFKSNFQDHELDWHRDREDRLVRPTEGFGWFLQIDDRLPVQLLIGKSYYIPAGVWHRTIKTNAATDLVVEIHKKGVNGNPSSPR